MHERDSLLRAYDDVRSTTERLVAPLAPEDMQVQSMPDASPTKWHLAHTTWFFETFVLAAFERPARVHDPRFGFLFNSYYEAVGARHPRPARGLLTRPSLDEVRAYRSAVDGRVRALVQAVDRGALPEIARVLTLGLHHEQQHQELILTDVQHALSCNPLRPAYAGATPHDGARASASSWIPFDGGLVWTGAIDDGARFVFDNETPRHRVWLDPFALASRAVTNGEFARFVEDGGYARADLWLSDGWRVVQERGWAAPLYWEKQRDGWMQFTLRGLEPLEDAAPVSHVSFYEADAYARWAGARLPTEAEWEHATQDRPVEGNLLETGALAPRAAADDGSTLTQLFGDVWEWTASPYVAYPRFAPAAGALGEYNGKFMCNQIVLRGGSCFTPRSHVRASYRNFFPPDARWQMSGVRLARWR